MDSSTLTVTLSADLGASLAELARAAGRSPEAIALDAIAEHVEALRDVQAKIRRGEADIAAGRLATHEDAMRDLALALDAADRTRGG